MRSVALSVTVTGIMTACPATAIAVVLLTEGVASGFPDPDGPLWHV